MVLTRAASTRKRPRASGDTVARCAVIMCVAVLSGHTLQAADSAFKDRLATLPLQQELDTRGNLGGVTIDRLGFLYVANFRDAVWRVDPDGGVVALSRGLYGSSGNAIDLRGDLLQANFYANTITRIRRTGEIETFAARGLSGPVGLAVDAEGFVFVCNCNGNTLSKVAPEGVVEPFADSDRFACPNGITFADDGNLYVTNFNHHDLLRVTPSGEVDVFTTVPGGAGNAHIAFSKGFFYVTKIIANQIVKVSMDGDVIPLAGNGEGGHQDGDALTASVNRPNGIAVSPTGDRLYINTLVGAYNDPSQRSQIRMRTVDLMTLTKALEPLLESDDLEPVSEAYRQYRSDPVRGRENTVGEMVALGYRFLRQRQITKAILIFRLNAESYPDDATAQFQLGEGYRYAGQNELARTQYEAALELDPTHQAARSRLAQLPTR